MRLEDGDPPSNAELKSYELVSKLLGFTPSGRKSVLTDGDKSERTESEVAKSVAALLGVKPMPGPSESQ